MQTLKEELLYRLLPEGVLDLDERKLLRSLVGGYQDRLSDLRSYVAKFESCYDPSAPFPETTAFNVLAVTFDDGVEVTRELMLTDATPLPENYATTADWESAAIVWAATELGLEPALISRVALARDPLQSVDANMLQYLASTVGAIVYKTGTNDPEALRAEQRRVLQSYFPRLKIKGSARSFAVLGQLLTYDDVKMTPLWGRVSPRLPNDVGNAVNDPDFKVVPESYPQQYFGVSYNPWDLVDGPFYTWESTVLSTQRSAQNFYPQGVNGYNPFFTLEVGAVGEVYHAGYPSTIYPQTFVLDGGGPHVKARCSAIAQNGTAVASMDFVAIAEGASFNGLEIIAVAPGSLAVVDQRLSAAKFRTSYYDLALAVDLERYAESAIAVRKNTDLSPADGGNPAFSVVDGVAVSPYRPWSGTVPREQASASDLQLNTARLAELGLQSSEYFDEVRAASRFPRRTTYGFLIRDQAQYAPYVSREVLFTADSLLSGSGTAAAIPLAPYTATMTVEYPDGLGGFTSTVLSAERDLSNPNQVNYLGANATGWYNFDTAQWEFTLDGVAEGQRVVATWQTLDTQVIRAEPSMDDKVAGLVSYQARPEDQLDDQARVDLLEDYSWRRELTGLGEVVNTNHYLTSVPDASMVPLDREMTVLDHSGVPHRLYGVDYPSTSSPRPRRFFTQEASISGKPAWAIADGRLYSVGLVQGVLVADPLHFNSAVHREGLVAWAAFNQHPESAKGVSDHSNTQGDFTTSGVASTDRVWDSTRGWVLRLAPGSSVVDDTWRNLGASVAFSVWLKPAAPAAGTAMTILELGSTRVLSGQVIEGQAYRVLGTGTVRYGTTVYPYLDDTGVTVDRFIGTAVKTFTVVGSAKVIEITKEDSSGNEVPVISVDLDSSNQLLFYCRQGAVRVLFHTAALTEDTWSFIGFSQTGTAYDVVVKTGNTVVSSSGTNDFSGFDPKDIFVGCAGARHSVQWSDLRLWNCAKAPDMLISHIASYARSPLPFAAPPTYFFSTVRQDRCALEVLPSGWVLPEFSSPSPRVALSAMSRWSGMSPLSGTLSHAPLLPESVVVTHGTVVTTDDGAGAITPDGTVTGGSIDYATGVVSVEISTAGTQQVQVDYFYETYDVNREPLAGVARYNGEGEFRGESRYEQLGLGEGQEPAVPWRLGQQRQQFESSGSTVVSTQFSALPGENELWLQTTVGQLVRVEPPYGQDGGVVTLVAAGTTSPWPNLTPNENALQHRVWIKGDNGLPYEVTLEDRGEGPVLSAALVTHRRTSAELALWSTGTLWQNGTLSSAQTAWLEHRAVLAANEMQLADGTQQLSVREIMGEAHVGEQAGLDTTDTTLQDGMGNVRLLFATSGLLDRFERVALTLASPQAGLAAGTYYGEVLQGAAQATWLSGTTTVAGYDIVVRLSALSMPGEPALALTTDWSLNKLENEVYAKSGSAIRPPAYLYLDHIQEFSAVGAEVFANWDDQQPGGSGNYAFLQAAGMLTFTNAGSLPAGRYLVALDVGNLGKVDPGFTGFTTEITVGDTIVPVQLLPNGRGVNPRGVTTFEVSLPAISSPWQLIIEWTNDYDVPARGYTRALAVYGYTLNRLQTKGYRVDSSLALTDAVLTDSSFHLDGYAPAVFTSVLSSGSNTSGIAYNPNQNSVIVARNSSPCLFEYDLDGNQLRQISLVTGGLSNWTDPESLCWMTGNLFAVAEENRAPQQSKITLVTIPNGTAPITLNHTTDVVASWDTGLAYGNLGVEGVAYDPDRDLLYFTSEKSSAGTSTTGFWNVWSMDPATGDVTALFDLVSLVGVPGLASDIADLVYDRNTGHFLILAEEPLGSGGNRVIEVAYDWDSATARVVTTREFAEFTQPEGLCLTSDRRSLFICGEPAQFARYDYRGPGGWVAQLDSNGTSAHWVHESQRVPSLRPFDGDVGYEASYPQAALLTATTPHRLACVTFSGTNPVQADDPVPAAPAVTAVGATEGALITP